MISKSTLKDLIPHGHHQKVAKKARVSPAAVSRYFSNKIKSSSKIYKAALEVAKENRDEVYELETSLNRN